MPTIDTPTPFDLDVYWSESQAQFMSVADMPLPYARNAYAKLVREHGDTFLGTTLDHAFATRLIPSREDMSASLLRTGAVSVYAPTPREVARTRARVRRVGAKLGVKVHTHHKGDFVEGTCAVPDGMQVNVRRVVR